MKGSFAQGLQAFKEKVEAQLTQMVVKVVLDVHGQNIVMPSPVLSGRYMANNTINLNTLPTSSILAFDTDGNATIEAGKGVMASYKLGDTVFLSNNVAYALAIEEGHSGQAPHGVYRIAAAEMIAEFERMARAGV